MLVVRFEFLLVCFLINLEFVCENAEQIHNLNLLETSPKSSWSKDSKADEYFFEIPNETENEVFFINSACLTHLGESREKKKLHANSCNGLKSSTHSLFCNLVFKAFRSKWPTHCVQNECGKLGSIIEGYTSKTRGAHLL